MCESSGRLAVEADGDDERTRLRLIEIIETQRVTGGTTEIRLRIVAGVPGPRLEIAARQAQIDGREAERALHEVRIERVAHRDLAQLHIAAVLIERLVEAGEEERGRLREPVHADRHCRTGAGSDDRTIVPATLSERLEVARAHGVARGVEGAVGALLRVLVRTVGVERALGAVVDHAAVLEVEQAGDLEFPDV